MPKQKVFETRAINTETWTEFVKESVNDWKKYIYSVVEQVESVESEIVKAAIPIQMVRYAIIIM